MRRIFVVLAVLVAAFAGPAAAQPPYDDELTRRHIVTEAESWAWASIRNDEIADLNLRCDPSGKTRLDPHNDDARWDVDCRRIGAKFIADVLTDPQCRDQIKRHGLRLQGARIDGDLDLVDAKIEAELKIKASRIDGKLHLTDAHFAHSLSLEGTRARGDLAGERLSVESDLSLFNHARFEGRVILTDANVGNSLGLADSIFEKTVDGDGLFVRNNLYLHKSTFKEDLSLIGVKIGREMSIIGSTFKSVMLFGANVDNLMLVTGDLVEGTFNSPGLSVGGSLFLNDKSTFKGLVSLVGAKIGGHMLTNGSTFEGNVNGSGLSVGGSLVLNNGSRFASLVNFTFAHVGGGIDLRGAIANSVDLSGAVVSQDLELGGGGLLGLQWQCAGQPPGVPWPLDDPTWRVTRCRADEGGPLPRLILRNAQLGALQDSADAWPPNLDLEGLKYDRLGGFGGEGAADMRSRPPEQWRDWLERDHTFSPQPYTQLANVLLTAGRRDSAEAIQYYGRERERHETKSWSVWLWLTFLWSVAGYGVGLYTFRVLWWVLGLTLLGSVVLWYSPYARSRGVLWRLGASLHRLLPIVELNKEFKDFFDNAPPTYPGGGPPNFNRPRPNLNRFQVAFFSAIALAGWILSFFLLAAMSGLTPKG